MVRLGYLAVSVLCLAGLAHAEGLGPLRERPQDSVVACLMASGLMEDAAMFIAKSKVTVIGPSGWQVIIAGAQPAAAEVDARDAAGRPDAQLRGAFQAALDACR